MRDILKQLVASWFKLTPDEQKAVCVIAAIFLLGVIVRFWDVVFVRT
ncbi:MAG: hypothetical protein R6V03_07630 [Kiritimatiellia bacterium]